jgi:hypothetical protein
MKALCGTIYRSPGWGTNSSAKLITLLRFFGFILPVAFGIDSILASAWFAVFPTVSSIGSARK